MRLDGSLVVLALASAIGISWPWLARESTCAGDEGYEAVGEQMAALYAEWSEEQHREIFEDRMRPQALRAQLEWFRDALGECETTPTVLEVRHARQARFALACEGGILELEPYRDPEGGKAHGLRIGARDIEPPAVVSDAAQRALALLSTWDAAAYEELFTPGFVEEHPPEEFHAWLAGIAEEHGACTLGPVDLANPRGAIYFLACERGGSRIMKVHLGSDDRIRTFLIRPPRDIRPAPATP